MDGRCGDAKRGLRRHTSCLGPFDGGDDIADIIQAAEDAGDIDTLSVLDLVLQLSHIIGHRIHAQSVEAAVEHVGLDTYFIERFAESTHGGIGVLAGEQVDLFESTAVGFHTVENSHVDDDRCDALQLVLAGLELA